MISYQFGRELRLLTPAEFQNIFDNPFRVTSRHFTLLCKPNDFAHPRLGMAIAKKHLKHATRRNAVKRHARETFRLQQHKLPPLDMVLFARAGIVTQSDDQIHSELEYVWRKTCRRYKESR